MLDRIYVKAVNKFFKNCKSSKHSIFFFFLKKNSNSKPLLGLTISNSLNYLLLARIAFCALWVIQTSSAPFSPDLSDLVSLVLLLLYIVFPNLWSLESLKADRSNSMGGVTFPCFVINTTNVTSCVLKFLFNLLTRLTFMLEEVLIHLGLINLPEDQDFSADHQYLTYSVLSTDSFRSGDQQEAEKTTLTLIKISLPVVEYGDFMIRRFKGRDDVMMMTCIICLDYVEKSDKIRELSNCCHVFHQECLDAWLNNDQLTCPLCRCTL